MAEKIKEAVLELQEEGKLPQFEIGEIQVDYPKDEKFGDYATNTALVLSEKAGKKPMEIAKLISNKIKDENIQNVEVAGPGYINFYLSPEYFSNLIQKINEEGENFGNNESGKGKRVNLEFISANPTGPIHLGNARGGPLGDTLANILEKSGYEVTREYYVNDFGNQVEILGHSVLGDNEAQYKGEYIENLKKKKSAELKNAKEIGIWAAGEILEGLIKPSCEKLGINFDNWFSEKSLHERKKTEEVVEILKNKGLAYEKDGALWFKSTEFGDDKDRVIIKSDGNKTYIVTDFAYHQEKFNKGYNCLINIQGTDHHKEAEVMKSFAENVLGQKGKLKYILTQMVRIIKDGKELKMSKRKGVYYALDDLLEEVGKDAVRFIFLSYAPNSHINFDIDLALQKSEKNPVFYAQYAHARISSILKKSEEFEFKEKNKSDGKMLGEEKEINLIRELNKFPELIEDISKNFEAHKLPHYAVKLADKFHSFYDSHRVLDENDPETSKARLNLINAVRIVMKETLKLIGVNSPEKM